MSEKDKDSDLKTPETGTAPATGPLSPEEQTRLNEALMEAVKEGGDRTVRTDIERGADVNYQDPRNGFAPLHYAAAYSARASLVALIHSGKCDYLLREHKGRYPSEVAYELGDDLRIANILSRKEARQAHRTGVKAWPKPPFKKS